MTDEDSPGLSAQKLAGRIIVLEAMVMTALGMAARDLGSRSPEQMIGHLNGAKYAVRGRLVQEGITPEGIQEAHRYEDEILSQYSEMLIPKKR